MLHDVQEWSLLDPEFQPIVEQYADLCTCGTRRGLHNARTECAGFQWEYALCKCGHDEEGHEHDDDDTECWECAERDDIDCSEFRPRSP